MDKKQRIIAAAGAAAAIAGICAYKYFNRDLTGMTVEEIAAFQAAHPHINISYTVSIEGGETVVTLDESSTAAQLSTPAQAEDLMDKSGYLQGLTHIDLGSTSVTSDQLEAMAQAFPNAELSHSHLNVMGELYEADIKRLDMSHIDSTRVNELIADLKHLHGLETLELRDKEGGVLLSVEDALAIRDAYPELHIGYTMELFGQTVDTDMTELLYKKAKIGDEGLDEIRRIMPLMDNLTYLRLDSCGTTDEATAQLREELKDRCKVVWRIHFGMSNCLTDTYKIWADWAVNDTQTGALKYCNEVKYLDMGHSHYTNVDFLAYMPDLEMAIIAIGLVSDLSGIENCTKLEYLEVFSNEDLTDEDMQHLAGLTNIKYLNISNTPKLRDLSFTDNMTELKMLWSTMNYIDKEEIERVQQLHPDCVIKNFRGFGDPTDYGWRFTQESKYTKFSPTYQLVRARFGYDTRDHAHWDSGYLREEITFESLGITPP